MNEQQTPPPPKAEQDQNIFLAVVIGMGRTTTITSRLSPARYWQRLEMIGIETEHKYLFEELSRRLNGAR